MRKVITLVFGVLGIGAGWLSANDVEGGAQIVMMAVGALFGGGIGGGLAQMGKRPRTEKGSDPAEDDFELIPGGAGTSSQDLAANFWRDEGHAPFTRPPR